MNAETTVYTTFESPFVTLVIVGSRGKIIGMQLKGSNSRLSPMPSWRRADEEFTEARSQMAAYFAGELREFSLPLELSGTPFQQHAWRLLRAVPYGTTTTYGDIARKMGRPNASRAVGGAMNRNPITIVVPCHRVVGKSGSLTGYLNGTEMKRSLIEMEFANRETTRTKVAV